MPVIFQKILAAYLTVITFFAGIFGIELYPVKDYAPPEGGAQSLEKDALFEEYNLPEFSAGKLLGIYESSDKTVIGRYEETDEADFTAYIDALTSDGFRVYDKNEIENNKFATLIKDETGVYVSRFANTKTLRIIAEPLGGLYPLEDNTEGEYETLITGMKGETSVANEGMGFIIRLKDGSFCIIDGGMGDADHVDSDKLMGILNAQKPEGTEKPVIAAWIFTHCHGDHIGVFGCFSIDHHDDVEIENIYFNFPKDEEIKKSDSTYMLDDSIYRFTQFRKNLTEYYSEVPVVKLHSGNRFQVRNASFEVLYAYDDLYPLTILNGGMNENSLLMKMTVEGQTILWTGDIAFNATDLVLWEYNEALKADFLQLAHHGLNGTKPFYSRVNPKYAFMPVWDGAVTRMLSKNQNLLLVENKDFRQMFITCYGTWTIAMPYNTIPEAKDRVPVAGTEYPSYPTLLGQ